MEELIIEIANVKNICKVHLSLPVDAGLYAIVGENATGKSTLMLAYPSYIIGDLYAPDGFDYMILVEDVLAKQIVEKVLREENMRNSRLIFVEPCGDWYNNLRLHRDMKDNSILGFGKRIISIIDGDVEDKVKEKKEFDALPKTFLPINSLEKYGFYTRQLLEKDDRQLNRKCGQEAACFDAFVVRNGRPYPIFVPPVSAGHPNHRVESRRI